MNQFIKYVGLDTHKDTIAVASGAQVGQCEGNDIVHATSGKDLATRPR
jgi:hypothetical protein